MRKIKNHKIFLGAKPFLLYGNDLITKDTIVTLYNAQPLAFKNKKDTIQKTKGVFMESWQNPPSFPTPYLWLQEEILNENIKNMAQKAKNWNVHLRPHIKTHKSPWIAHKQLQEGAIGITCAKLSEAQVMIEHGLHDIFIANLLVREDQKKELIHLRKNHISLFFFFYSLTDLQQWNHIAQKENIIIPLALEIDTGLHRCGIPHQEAQKFLQKAQEYKNIQIIKCYSHNGHSYGALSLEDLYQKTKEDILIMQHLPHPSIGSTPSLGIWKEPLPSIEEIRPGNYVFFDHIAYKLGACLKSQLALAVVSTIIGEYDHHYVCDAGSKSLGLDKGAHSQENIKNYGLFLENDFGLERLSEEHGIFQKRNHKYNIGDKIVIFPNHSCYVMNLFDEVYVQNKNHIRKEKILARGKNI